MSEEYSLNSSVIKAMKIMNFLMQDDFKGKSLNEIYKGLNFSCSTCFRILKSLESEGWVVGRNISGGKEIIWCLGKVSINTAFQYKRHSLNEAQQLKSDYLNITGEELS